MPPSGDINSKSALPNPIVITSEVPSNPATLSALITALGKVSCPVELGDTVMSNMILPTAPLGKFKNENVVFAVIVKVW